MSKVTKELLQKLFEYKDGKLIRKVTVNSKAKAGDVAGWIKDNGYICVSIQNKTYYVHRLIYIYHFGDIDEGLEIDHIDRDRANNKIENIRLVTRQQNNFNRKVKGYCFDKRTQKWMAYIGIGCDRKHLGRYETQEEARKAYLIAKDKFHTVEPSIEQLKTK